MQVTKDQITFDVDQIHRFNKKTTFEEVVRTMSNTLIQKNLVKKEYPDHVIAREKKFPTGLPTKPFGVAIPHTDAKWTNHNAICVGILKEPIDQIVMGTDDTPVKVSIVFMLALGQSNKQLNILSKLMTVFQNQDTLKKLKSASDDEVKEIVEKAVLEA